MSGRLGRVIDRALGRAPVLAPRSVPLFATEAVAAPVRAVSLFADRRSESPAVEPETPEAASPTPVPSKAAAPRNVARPADPAAPPSILVARANDAVEDRLRRVDEARRREPAPRADDLRERPQFLPTATTPPRPAEARSFAAPLEAPRSVDRAPEPLREERRPRNSTPAEPSHAFPRELRPALAPPSLFVERRANAPIASGDLTPREPAIHVTIGRVEVRAVAPAPAARPRASRAVPTVSLDDYLRRREGR
jgi:hypothetical protein